MNKYEKLLGTVINDKLVKIVLVAVTDGPNDHDSTNVMITEKYNTENVKYNVSTEIGELCRFSTEYFREKDRNTISEGKLKPKGMTTLHLFHDSISHPIEYRIIFKHRIFKPFSK